LRSLDQFVERAPCLWRAHMRIIRRLPRAVHPSANWLGWQRSTFFTGPDCAFARVERVVPRSRS
jgi:hypothetical protein